jgi:hypothetical protein
MTTWHDVMNEHTPRPVGDRFEHPWWAKGEYARKNDTKWTAPDGTRIEAGKVVSLGDTSWSPDVAPRSVSETPAATRVARPAREPDEASRRLAACRSDDEILDLFSEFGVDPSWLTNPAPNGGVRKMRMLNALRRAMAV